jgi:hypothetical protein
MPGTMSCRIHVVPPCEVSSIVADTLALDRVRIWRRLLATRGASLALLALLASFVGPGLSVSARCLAPVLFVAPALGAWLFELRIDSRLSKRLDGLGRE